MTDRVLFILAILLMALLSCFEIKNYDIGFHLATGRWILETGVIPSSNVLSYTQPEHDWPLHYWASAVLFAWIHSFAGATGLVVLRMVLVVATFIFVLRTSVRVGASWPVASTICMLGGSAAALRFLVRPHLFSYLFLAIAIDQLFAWRNDQKPGRLLGVGALIVIAANFHAGVVYLILVGGAVAGVELLSKRWGRALNLAVMLVAGSLSAGLAVASYNPSGLQTLLVPFRFGSDPFLNEIILEFRGISWFDFAGYPFFWSLVCLAFGSLVATKRRSDLWLWAIGIVGVLAAVRHQRLIFLAAILLIPAASVGVTQLMRTFQLDALKRLSPAIAATAMLVIAGLGVQRYEKDHVFGTGFNTSEHPGGALDFMAAKDVEGPAFTTDVFSGPYLERFHPSHKVFYDNRMEAYDIDFIRTVYLPTANGLPGWRRHLEEYGVSTLLLAYSAGDGSVSTLSSQLNESTEYSLVYFDDIAMVWVRKTPGTVELIQQMGFQRLNPDRFTTQQRQDWATLEADLRSRLERKPASVLAYWYLGGLLNDQGRYSDASEVIENGLKQFPSDERLLVQKRRSRRQ